MGVIQDHWVEKSVHKVSVSMNDKWHWGKEDRKPSEMESTVIRWNELPQSFFFFFEYDGKLIVWKEH